MNDARFLLVATISLLPNQGKKITWILSFLKRERERIVNVILPSFEIVDHA
jgi:hypothetical protein